MPSNDHSSVPVTLLSGYLGSGKTTLVNHVLRNANGLRIAVMVNDFGDLPIDASLIVAEDEDIIQLSGGCVCCSYGNDLIRALIRLQELLEKPEHVLIECSGVALPAPVRMSLSLIQELVYDGTVGLIDGSQVLKQLQDRYIGDTVERQISQADMLFVSKTDLVTADSMQAVHDQIALITSTPLVNIESGRVPLDAVLSSKFSSVVDVARTDDAKQIDSRFTHANFDSVVVRAQVGLKLSTLKKQLTTKASGILRAKGFVYADDGCRYLLQMVGDSCSFEKMNSNETAELADKETAFVVIGVKGRFVVPSLN